MAFPQAFLYLHSNPIERSAAAAGSKLCSAACSHLKPSHSILQQELSPCHTFQECMGHLAFPTLHSFRRSRKISWKCRIQEQPDSKMDQVGMQPALWLSMFTAKSLLVWRDWCCEKEGNKYGLIKADKQIKAKQANQGHDQWPFI